MYNDVTATFCALSMTPASVDHWLKSLERFVILIYDRTSDQICINLTRKQLFTQKGRTLDCIPPTKAALIQHTKRAAYQAGHCWGQMMIPTQDLPSPGDWGWKKNDNCTWDIYWTSSARSCCGMSGITTMWMQKGMQRAVQKCIKALLPCTALCRLIVVADVPNENTYRWIHTL